jgi:hypothetical protein
MVNLNKIADFETFLNKIDSNNSLNIDLSNRKFSIYCPQAYRGNREI